MNNPFIKTNSKLGNTSLNNKVGNTSLNNKVSNVKNALPNTTLKTILIILCICLVIYLIICMSHYLKLKCFEKKTFFQYLFDFSNNEVCIKENAPVAQKPQPPQKSNKSNDLLSIIQNKKEVFHIANQDYTYEQSKCKCESYGAKLATKEQLIDAYNNGAHWCTYGWMDKQTAFYPVQQCEWDKIKGVNDRLKDKNKMNYCGVPGLNGGYFANPQLKFGINCYGVKPKGKINKQKSPYCDPVSFCKLEQNYQASNKLDTDEITSFNNEKWNM
jgi:hypothetical protein